MTTQAIKEDAEKDLAEATPALEEGTYVHVYVCTSVCVRACVYALNKMC